MARPKKQQTKGQPRVETSENAKVRKRQWDYDKKQRKKAEKAAQQLIDDRPVPEPLVATGVVEDAEPSEDPIGDFTGDEVPMGEDEESLYPGQEATRPVPAALPTLSDPWADFDELMGIVPGSGPVQVQPQAKEERCAVEGFLQYKQEYAANSGKKSATFVSRVIGVFERVPPGTELCAPQIVGALETDDMDEAQRDELFRRVRDCLSKRPYFSRTSIFGYWQGKNYEKFTYAKRNGVPP